MRTRGHASRTDTQARTSTRRRTATGATTPPKARRAIGPSPAGWRELAEASTPSEAQRVGASQDRGYDMTSGGETTMRDTAMPKDWRSESHCDCGPIAATTNRLRPAIAMPRLDGTARPNRYPARTPRTGHRHRPTRPATPAAAATTAPTPTLARVPSATATAATHPNQAARFSVAARFDRQPPRPAANAAATTQASAGIPSATATTAANPNAVPAVRACGPRSGRG